MVTVHDIEQYLFSWAPQELAADWDNVGHLVGDAEAEVRKILVSLDITENVVEEAISSGCDLIISHHPVMNCTWHKVQNIRSDRPQGRMLMNMVRHGISAICMHTNLDAAEGGVNDVLAEKLGLTDIKCFNDEKIGRFGLLKCEMPLVDFTHSVIKCLSCNGLRYTDAGKSVHRVAVGGGACGDYISQAIAMGCDTFVTSDLSYHQFLDHREINLIDAGHFPTENVICPVIIQRLKDVFAQLTILPSTAHDREVIQYCIKGEE